MTPLTTQIGESRLGYRGIHYVNVLCFPRRVWTPEEDDAIRQLVEKYGTKTWSVIAEAIVKEFAIDGRTGKQCRERWHNHLGMLQCNNKGMQV